MIAKFANVLIFYSYRHRISLREIRSGKYYNAFQKTRISTRVKKSRGKHAMNHLSLKSNWRNMTVVTHPKSQIIDTCISVSVPGIICAINGSRSSPPENTLFTTMRSPWMQRLRKGCIPSQGSRSQSFRGGWINTRTFLQS